jgi:hypothetical protein
MLGTYASLLILLGAAALAGQAILALSGHRRPSPLAPAVGLAALCAVGWWTVRLPGEGTAAAIAIGATAAISALILRGRVDEASVVLRRDAPVALAAIVLASIPFIVEARFGILGTGLNPDMSQHLFAVDRLAAGGSERLIAEGYPLGPHAVVAALAALGPSTVEAFNGLTMTVAVAATLVALTLLEGLGGWRRFCGALAAGFAYLVAAYLVQGSFKETLQALFVIAFAAGLHEIARRPDATAGRRAALAAVPLAVLAAGSAYVYSFPGLLWLGGTAGVWALVELFVARRRDAAAVGALRRATPAVLVATAVLAAAALPELGRMIDFASFETFNPQGDGLGNLFNRLSPLEALGIWPSGDFRLEPGDGAVPALAFYLGATAGLAALAFGLRWSWRRGERALPAAIAAAAALWLYSLIAGTPYQEAKALVLLAAPVALVSVRAVASAAPAPLAAGFLAAVGACGVLVLANGPVGPTGYSPELAELRPQLHGESVLVVAPPELLDDQHGRDYLVWELRGNRICVASAGDGVDPQTVVDRALTVELDDGAVVPAGGSQGRVGPAGGETCPFIPDGARADPSAAGG